MTGTTRYDAVVVGGGSSGAALAARLSASGGRRVLLIEAGPDLENAGEVPAEMRTRATSDSAIRHSWGFTAEVTTDQTMSYPVGKVMGGSSAINSAVALRGAPADYDEWEALGNPGWGWADVLPSFRRLETDLDFHDDGHGRTGPMPIRRTPGPDLLPVHRGFRDAALAAGFPGTPDLNNPGSSGVGTWPRNVAAGGRVSTAQAYLAPAVRARPNLDLLPDTVTARLRFRGDTVTGVECLTGSGPVNFDGDEVILCAGAISTPGILVRSGIGAADAVATAGAYHRVDLPGVGQNLMDHPYAWLSMVPADGVCDLDDRSVQVGLRYSSAAGNESDDMQAFIVLPVELPVASPIAAQHGCDRIFMLGACVQRPEARGRVRWLSADPLQPPRVELGYDASRLDLDRLIEGLRLCWRLAQAPEMAPYHRGIAELSEETLTDDVALRYYVTSHLITLKHASGTARMGPADDPLAVVDHRLRVHGVGGLRVADASVMPVIPRSNTNLTCIMIGEHLAGLIERGQ